MSEPARIDAEIDPEVRLSRDEKRALQRTEGLLYDSVQFPLFPGTPRRGQRPAWGRLVLGAGALVGLLLLVGIVALGLR